VTNKIVSGILVFGKSIKFIKITNAVFFSIPKMFVKRFTKAHFQKTPFQTHLTGK